MEDFFIDQEYKKRELEARRAALPHCSTCEYVGPPHRDMHTCPACGAEMKDPEDPDQAAYDEEKFMNEAREFLDLDEPPQNKE